ncbi:VOC family protein [Amycolatopsis sp.]|uniref:VOC family protein n=1 Tax=Amycolatopsis sp. TaxID=37632 RepID=UPI003457E366
MSVAECGTRRRERGTRRRECGTRGPSRRVPHSGLRVPHSPTVDDLDQATEQAKALGAEVVRERTELPAGSLVVIDDPTGATLVLWKAKTP